MAILKLRPSYKDYLWGGERLKTNFGKQYDGDILAESWELSCHPDGPSFIDGGINDGKSLGEYIESEGKQVLGSKAQKFEDFPILIKFIDAKGDLSIQVHPSDEYALIHEHQYGKTEMWYVVDATEDAFLYYGFKEEVSREEFKRRIENNTLTDVLNHVQVKKGDSFFIESGTIHAIGAGCLIAEIQQNSNITYRVYDYGRRDKDGNLRQLHVEKALEVTNRAPANPKSFAPHIASCAYFTVDYVMLDGESEETICGMVDGTTFCSILVLEGEGCVKTAEEVVVFKKGDSLFSRREAVNIR